MKSLLLGVLVGLIVSASVGSASGVSQAAFIWAAVTVYLLLAIWGVIWRLLLKR